MSAMIGQVHQLHDQIELLHVDHGLAVGVVGERLLIGVDPAALALLSADPPVTTSRRGRLSPLAG